MTLPAIPSPSDASVDVAENNVSLPIGSRPTSCVVCGCRPPLIDGRCLQHRHVTTQAWLDTVSAEDALEENNQKVGT